MILNLAKNQKHTMKNIGTLIALITTISICAVISMMPSGDIPKKSEITALATNDTTYGEIGHKQNRVIKLRTRPCQLLRK
jgi:hypothetical protein